MPLATYTLQVDWNDDGDFADTGEDVTARLLHLEWERGRDYASQLTGRSISGKLRAVLLNTSGDYSSFNTSSPIAGNIVPGRKVRLDGGTGSFPYTFPIVFNDKPHFVGFLDKLTPVPNVSGRDVAILEAWGPLGYLNQKHVSVAMKTNVATGTSIGDILDDAGWPSGDRAIDPGLTTMTRFWVDRQRTMSALRLVEETEGGFVWEAKNGDISFDDRHNRLTSPHTTSQATFTDAAGGARVYSRIKQSDPHKALFTEFEATIQLYDVGSLATLWTHPEAGSASPLLAPGESRRFIAQFPNPDASAAAFAVDAWTTLVSTTDYTANTASDGSGTDRTASVGVSAESKLAEVYFFTLTNNHASNPIYITLLQARGTPVDRRDPVRVLAEDTTTKFGERTYPNPSRFLPDSAEGQAWADYNLSIYKVPIPILEIWFMANRSHNHLVEALVRDIGDRVTLVGTNSAGLGINEDFFIEHEKHVVNKNRHHWVRWQLSPASGYSNFWILDTSELDTETVLAY